MPFDQSLQTRLPKVLIVAPNASSAFGGEAFIPLQYFRILKARGHPVRMITHARNRDDLSISAAPHQRDIEYVEDTVLHRWLHRWSAYLPSATAGPVIGALMAMLDRRIQTRIIRRLLASDPPDLIHQPTPVSPLTPSGLHRFGLPLVVGPMNGGMQFPPGYDRLQGQLARAFVRWSRFVAWATNRLVSGKRHAAMLLVANSRTRDALPFSDHSNVRMLTENGIDTGVWQHARDRSGLRQQQPGCIRLAYVGRLIDWKLVDVTLEAVQNARQRGVSVSIEIVGDGPELSRLVELAARLQLDGAVRFHGFKAQHECAVILAGVDALILNSVWECGGAVVLEAMASGLPVIATHWGGPADYLDSSCGMLVSPIPAASFSARLADAIVILARSPETRASLGAAGALRAGEHFDWNRKVDQMVGIYAEVCRSTGSGPTVD